MNLNKMIKRAGILLLLTVNLVIFSCIAQNPNEVSNLIEASDLKKMISNNQNFALIDFRDSYSYKNGHIPGAIHLEQPELRNRNIEYGGMVAPKSIIEKVMSKAGIKSNQKIIIYDDKGGVDASRLWWTLTKYGHDNTYLLNGGLKSWKEYGYFLTREIPGLTTVTFKFNGSENKNLGAGLDEVKNALGNSNKVILDVRSPEEYASGHIPGSINLEWIHAIDFNGSRKFKDKNELKQLYNKYGITPDKEVIVYCRSGVRASHSTFVLKELLGFKNVKNYDGSWIEWSYFKQPVEK